MGAEVGEPPSLTTMDLYLLIGVLIVYLGVICGPRYGELLPVLNSRALMVTGLVLHGLAIIVPVIEQGNLPLNSMRWGLVAAGLSVAGVGLAIRNRPRMLILGHVLVGWSMLFLGLGLAAPDGRCRPRSGRAPSPCPPSCEFA